jgi:hypothetical protein
VDSSEVTLRSVHLTLPAATLFAEIDDDTPDNLN